MVHAASKWGATSVDRDRINPWTATLASLTFDALVRTRLRSLRQALGWSLDALGERSHLRPSTISRIENGKRTISLDDRDGQRAHLHSAN